MTEPLTKTLTHDRFEAMAAKFHELRLRQPRTPALDCDRVAVEQILAAGGVEVLPQYRPHEDGPQ